MIDTTFAGENDPAGVEAERAKAERLMAEIEDGQIVSGWVWSVLIDTYGRLCELPDHLAWVATRYLQAVKVRGDAMYHPNAQQTTLDDVPVPTLRCRCGEDAPQDPEVRRNGRLVVTAACPACGIHLAQFDGEPYRGPTLISKGHVW